MRDAEKQGSTAGLCHPAETKTSPMNVFALLGVTSDLSLTSNLH